MYNYSKIVSARSRCVGTHCFLFVSSRFWQSFLQRRRVTYVHCELANTILQPISLPSLRGGHVREKGNYEVYIPGGARFVINTADGLGWSRVIALRLL